MPAEVRCYRRFASSGIPGGAVDMLEWVKTDWKLVVPRGQSVYCAASGAAGQREAARRLARTIDLAKLRDEERLLIANWGPD